MNNDNQKTPFVYQGALPGSPAEKSDLRIGDQIISVNGHPLLSLMDLGTAIESNRTKRIVEVLRGNKLITIELDMSGVNIGESNEVMN